MDINKEIDEKNIAEFHKYNDHKSTAMLFTCVVCGCKTNLAGSYSHNGHRVICRSCAKNMHYDEHNRFDIIKCIRWCRED